MSNYLISISKNEKRTDGIIHDIRSKLKIKAIDLIKKTKFIPRKGEKRFFVTAGRKTLAFETQGYNKQRELLILHMIAWYCTYLGLAGAQIHATLSF